MRADEHEGVLNSTENRRAGDARRVAAEKILGDNLLRLSVDGDFLLYFQRYAYPLLAIGFPQHGADLERLVGKRELICQIVKEMDEAVPGFLSRVLSARDDYEAQLLAAERRAEEK